MKRGVGVAVCLAGLLAIAGCATTSQRAPQAKPVETLKGKASYYHDSLSGNRTANGEIYDKRKLTAAHRSLPFCTVVRVVRVGTNQDVVVRINDRGPFGGRGRILDLSRAAAEEIGMVKVGVVSVRAEVLELGDGCSYHHRR